MEGNSTEWIKKTIRKKDNVNRLICDVYMYESEDPKYYGTSFGLQCYFNEKTKNPYDGLPFDKVILTDIKEEKHTIHGFEAEFNLPKICEYEISPEGYRGNFKELKCY